MQQINTWTDGGYMCTTHDNESLSLSLFILPPQSLGVTSPTEALDTISRLGLHVTASQLEGNSRPK